MSRPRILLIGTSGQLGWELQRCLGAAGELQALGRAELDVTRRDELQVALRAARADVMVNATAYTAVDRAESEPALARAVNADAPALMAEAARETGAALIHFSTDYVFDGRSGRPNLESDAPNPLGVYGRSKLEGEGAIQAIGGAFLILRTSWVYSLRRKSFVTQVLDWSHSQRTVRVVSDQVGNPTWARALAEATLALIERAGPRPAHFLADRAGLYHLAGAGIASRFEWARAIVELDLRPEEQIMQELEAAEDRDFPMAAQRPLFSALDCSLFDKTFRLRLPPWREALHAAMSEARWTALHSRQGSAVPVARKSAGSGTMDDAAPVPAGRPAIFLDRDGVIIENRDDYCLSWDQVTFLPGALQALARARSAPHAFVIITNQSAIGRGLLERQTADEINARLVNAIHASGGRVDGVYMCPHTPEADCACRKPKPGLIAQAARELSLDLGRSALIGDALSDLDAGHAAGVGQTILVRTGRGIQQLSLAGAGLTVCGDLSEALETILDRRTRAKKKPGLA